jgi:hypothetical protein
MVLSLNKDRLKHFIALACIGDGVLAIVRPRHDASTWSVGPAPWRHLMQALRRRPALTRMIGAAEVVGAICWIVSHDPPSAS